MLPQQTSMSSSEEYFLSVLVIFWKKWRPVFPDDETWTNHVHNSSLSNKKHRNHDAAPLEGSLKLNWTTW